MQGRTSSSVIVSYSKCDHLGTVGYLQWDGEMVGPWGSLFVLDLVMMVSDPPWELRQKKLMGDHHYDILIAILGSGVLGKSMKDVVMWCTMIVDCLHCK